ncbi:MAG TPA: DegT/DnrJ/EryC1/StrS family aminotransferase [Salinivirgaceae bacterium]|mgnify:CR=1 FL=1|nr:DegT/DnrJ/EryC1/StrS family aminotransferase [Salinivirgaceae bacterium]
MLPIEMVDLRSQYARLKNELEPAILSVASNANYINGKEVKDFATALEQYLAVKHVIPVANGTDALQIALMALGIGPGDEVITPDFTFIATVEVVALLGATPVVVDVNMDDFNINTEQLVSAINHKTKAIVPVHLFGQCANLDTILEVAQKHNIPVVEDAAQALGATFKGKKFTGKAGTLGRIGCTSFFPSKNLGCFGDGGAIFTNDDEMAETIRSIANHGSKIKYYHERLGVNSRLDTLQASILNVKLRHLDDFNLRRQNAAMFYDNALAGIKQIEIPKRNPFSDHIFHQYTIKVPEGKNYELQQWLKEHNIPSMIYYPVPIHRQEAFRQKLKTIGQITVSDILAKKVISLPMHTELTEEQLSYICKTIEQFFNR